MKTFALLLSAVAAVCAQPAAFDVAVIKPADLNNTRRGIGIEPGHRMLTISGLTASELIRRTYSIQESQITGVHLIGKRVTSAVIATMLSRQLERDVIDNTGLPGKYDFELTWTPDVGTCRDATSDSPSLFTAVQEQLGLRLDSKKGPTEILVIDHIGRPSGISPTQKSRRLRLYWRHGEPQSSHHGLVRTADDPGTGHFAKGL